MNTIKDTGRFEEEIERRFTDGTKPLVLTEGVSDTKYIRTALRLLGEETLLNSLEIQPVGVKVDKEWKYGGKDGLNRVGTFYKKDPALLDRRLLLLYDWDAKKPEETGEKVWVRTIPKNLDDTVEKPGIENLFPEHLFEDQFYDDEPKKGDHGREGTDPKFKKKEFCEWVCENRKNLIDFAKFDSVVEILRQFSEAHQSHSIEQLTTK